MPCNLFTTYKKLPFEDVLDIILESRKDDTILNSANNKDDSEEILWINLINDNVKYASSAGVTKFKVNIWNGRLRNAAARRAIAVFKNIYKIDVINLKDSFQGKLFNHINDMCKSVSCLKYLVVINDDYSQTISVKYSLFIQFVQFLYSSSNSSNFECYLVLNDITA